MSGQVLSVAIIGGLFALVLAWQLITPWRAARRRRTLMAQSLPAEWSAILARNFVLYPHLPASVRARLDGLVAVFLAEKRFVGCAGVRMSDEIRVTIAAQACLLIVQLADDTYGELNSVLVYPRAFNVSHSEADEYGIVHEGMNTLAGESWEEGRVIISWDDARDGGRQLADGMNVVMHEFAHQLDGLSGEVNGSPPQRSEAAGRRWERMIAAEYDRHCRRVDRDEPTLIDPYGAVDRAEFFAVATECFFERAAELEKAHPALYEGLRDFFGQDPASWTRAAA